MNPSLTFGEIKNLPKHSPVTVTKTWESGGTSTSKGLVFCSTSALIIDMGIEGGVHSSLTIKKHWEKEPGCFVNEWEETFLLHYDDEPLPLDQYSYRK